jgi:hypothetical protein
MGRLGRQARQRRGLRGAAASNGQSYVSGSLPAGLNDSLAALLAKAHPLCEL